MNSARADVLTVIYQLSNIEHIQSSFFIVTMHQAVL